MRIRTFLAALTFSMFQIHAADAEFREVARLDRLPRPMSQPTKCDYRVRLHLSADKVRYYNVGYMEADSNGVQSLTVPLSFLEVSDIFNNGWALFSNGAVAPQPSSPYDKSFRIDNTTSRFYIFEGNGGTPLNLATAYLESDCLPLGQGSPTPVPSVPPTYCSYRPKYVEKNSCTYYCEEKICNGQVAALTCPANPISCQHTPTPTPTPQVVNCFFRPKYVEKDNCTYYCEEKVCNGVVAGLVCPANPISCK